MVAEGEQVRRSFLQGALRLYVLSCAERRPVYGGSLAGALRRHGHPLSPGTLYPMLRDMEKRGWLSTTHEIHNGRLRKYYRTTPKGRVCLEESRVAVGGLVGEIFSLQN